MRKLLFTAFALLSIFTSKANQSQKLTHQIKLNFLIASKFESKEKLVKDFERARALFQECGILLKMGAINKIENPTLNDYETIWFNDNQLSSTEKELVENLYPDGLTVLVSDIINWSTEGTGTWGAAYAPYIPEVLKLDSEATRFYREKLLGHIILGDYRERWTLAHELGHSLLDLRHNLYYDNLMFSGAGLQNIVFDDNHLIINQRRPHLTIDQCAGKESSLVLEKYIP
jgi:hypothetical protein